MCMKCVYLPLAVNETLCKTCFRALTAEGWGVSPDCDMQTSFFVLFFLLRNFQLSPDERSFFSPPDS